MHIQYYVQGFRQEWLRSSLAEFGRSVDGEVIRQLSSTHYSRGAVYICIGEFIDFNPHDSKDYPTVGDIYVVYDISDRPLYIGQGMTIDKRLRNHYDKFWFKPPIVESASYLQIDDKPLRERVEAMLIKFLKSNAVINKQLVNRQVHATKPPSGQQLAATTLIACQSPLRASPVCSLEQRSSSGSHPNCPGNLRR